MKKRLLLVIGFIVVIIVSFNVFMYYKNSSNSDIVANLKGQIYYTKRVNEVLTLFKSDANLQNEVLVYSHKGKGKDEFGYNDNIIDFHYDIKNKNINLIAMNNGWSLFSVKQGEGKATLINNTSSINTDYIVNHTKNLNVSQKKGSIYIIKNGKEKCIKKFHGIYDDKFTGYKPMGFSPDGNYLIYQSGEHLTGLGVYIEALINDSYGHNYIMDLRTGKSARYIDAYEYQWVISK